MIELPHTGLKVPADSKVRVSSLRELETGRGVAIAATVRSGKTRLGMARNGGTGGDTYFEADSAEAMQAFAKFCKDCQLPREPISESSRQEDVLEALIEEFRSEKDVRRAKRRGESLVRKKDEYGFVSTVIHIHPPVDHLTGPGLKALQRTTYAEEPDALWQFWDGIAWQDLPALVV